MNPAWSRPIPAATRPSRPVQSALVATSSTGAIAIWADPGDQLLGRAVEHALRVRLPTWRIFGLYPDEATAHGCLRPLLAGVTMTVVCGGEPAPDTGKPLLLCGIRDVPPALAARAAAVSVRDASSRDALLAAGVSGDVAVIPHPGLLAARLLDPEDAPVRVRHLRRLGVLPEAGDYVLAPAEVIPGVPVVPDLPAGLALEDRLAAVGSARAVVATDEHTAAAAAGLGVRWALVDSGGAHRAAVREFADPGQLIESPADAANAIRMSQVDSLVALLDGHFDRIAAAAEQALGPGSELAAVALAAENAAVRAAHLRQRQRILLERERLIDPLADVWRERDAARAELDRYRAEHAVLSARVAELELEFAAWQNTKLVRWTRPLRGLYARLHAR